MANTETSPITRKLHYAWIVAFAGAAAIFCGLGLARFAFGMMLPSMATSLGLDYAKSGLFGFFNMAGYLIAVLFVPLVLSRLGTRFTMTASLILVSLSMFAMAFSETFLVLCVFYFFAGIGTGGVVLPAMSVMSQWFHTSHRGLASGIAMSGPGFGIVLSGFVVPKLIPMQGFLSWQTGWIIFATITVVVAGLVFALVRNHPRETRSLPFGLALQPLSSRGKMPRNIMLKLLVHLGLIYAIYGATYMLYVTFIVTSMIESYHLNEAAAGKLWAWFGFLSIFSGVLFGWLSDHFGRRAGMALAFGVLATAYLLVGLTDSLLGLYFSIILFGLAAWSIPVIMAASAGDFFGPAAAAKTLAALTFAFSGGQAAGPVLAGILAENTGDFSLSYAASGTAAILAVGLTLMLRPPKPQHHHLQ
jgi:MFS family permease